VQLVELVQSVVPTSICIFCGGAASPSMESTPPPGATAVGSRRKARTLTLKLKLQEGGSVVRARSTHFNAAGRRFCPGNAWASARGPCRLPLVSPVRAYRRPAARIRYPNVAYLQYLHGLARAVGAVLQPQQHGRHSQPAAAPHQQQVQQPVVARRARAHVAVAGAPGSVHRPHLLAAGWSLGLGLHLLAAG
jgi:hypothetical protein